MSAVEDETHYRCCQCMTHSEQMMTHVSPTQPLNHRPTGSDKQSVSITTVAIVNCDIQWSY